MGKITSKNMKRGISLLVVLALLIGLIPFCGITWTQAEETRTGSNLDFIKDTKGGISSNNLSGNEYIWFSADTVNSYLERNSDGTYTRVEAVQDKVYVEEYSQDFEFISSKELKMELPLFGGYFSGEDYRFLVFGQQNPEESDEVEVLRIVKYDRSWNRLDKCSVFGANTTIPFRAGSLRMTESGGELYLHTSHQMYQAEDGYNHQANMTYVMDETTMTVTQSWFGVMNINYGYVSHSFNQFVATDGTYLYRLDHGDAYPRAVVLTKASANAITACRDSNKEILKIEGEVGNNYTGVSVGGFELAGDQLVTAGNSVVQSESNYNPDGQRNIFVNSTDTELSESQTIWLTEYKDNSVAVGNPHLVKASEDELYVLWEEAESVNGSLLRTIKIAKINAYGQLQGEISTIYARLSDCQPIYTEDDALVWYVTSNDVPVFYHVSLEKLSEYEFTGRIDLSECEITLTPSAFEFDGYNRLYIPEVSVFYGMYELKEETDYQVSFYNNGSLGTARAVIQGMGIFDGSVTREFEIVLKDGTTAPPDESSDSWFGTSPSASPKASPAASTSPSSKPTATPKPTATVKPGTTTKPNEISKPGKVQLKSCKSNKKGRITIKWKKVSEADGYQIQYSKKRSFAGKKEIAVFGKSKTFYVKSKQKYYVRVRAFRYGNLKEMAFGKWSKVKKVKVK